jgi:death-on-curing protein
VEAALALPRATYGGQELYPDLLHKAAILAYSFAAAQRCPNGNKRLALLMLVTFLAINGVALIADEDEAADKMLEVAQTTAADQRVTVGGLASWIANHSRPLDDDL